MTYFSDSAPDEFGALDRAMVSLFRLPAGDAWVEALPSTGGGGAVDYGVVAYLTSFILVVNWTLLPITLAIMVNSFFVISAAQAQEEEDHRRAEAEQAQVGLGMEWWVGGGV